jgi:hypothetical protein
MIRTWERADKKSVGNSSTLHTPERIRTSGLWFRSLFLTLPVLAFQPFSWLLFRGFCPLLARVAHHLPTIVAHQIEPKRLVFPPT